MDPQFNSRQLLPMKRLFRTFSFYHQPKWIPAGLYILISFARKVENTKKFPTTKPTLITSHLIVIHDEILNVILFKRKTLSIWNSPFLKLYFHFHPFRCCSSHDFIEKLNFHFISIFFSFFSSTILLFTPILIQRDL